MSVAGFGSSPAVVRVGGGFFLRRVDAAHARGLQSFVHERVYIGIGSNIAPRHATIHSGVRALGSIEGIHVVRLSRLIETDPVGPPGQGPYLNGACELRTSLTPRMLLATMLNIERRHGRDRSVEQRWGPRTLDLDLLRFGQRHIEEDGLCVPHPRMLDRPFVMIPLREIGGV